jgi:hypothetical protein
MQHFHSPDRNIFVQTTPTEFYGISKVFIKVELREINDLTKVREVINSRGDLNSNLSDSKWGGV